HGVARVVGGMPFAVDQPPGRHFLSLVVRNAQLALRNGAGRVIEDERRLAGKRYADTAGIGAEASIAAAVGRDARMRDDVHELDRDEPLGYRHLGPVADAAEMMH